MGGLKLQYAALSDVGRYRKDNQDSGYAGPHLLVIADGVGGAAYGDVASHTAIQILRRLDEEPTGDVLEALAGTVHRVHDRLAELVEEDPDLEGTSTTLTAGIFDGARLGVAHLGDSRAYLLRGGELTQITDDHTFVQALIDEGRITEEESRSHPHRNLILKAVDSVHETEPDLFFVDLEAGDRLLFCSDGCSGVFAPDDLGALLGEGSVDLAAVELVRTSLDNGTTDNVTVVVADVVEGDTPVGAETEASASTGPMLVGAAAGLPRKLDSEATLTRGVPVAPTATTDSAPSAGDDVDPEELRYALRPPRRFVWVRRSAVLLVLLGLIGVGLKFGYDWSQEQYYVAADESDEPVVTIYRGVDLDLPFVTMSRQVDATATTEADIPLTALPETVADTVRDGFPRDSLADAEAYVANLYEQARACPPEEELTRQERRRQAAEEETPRPTTDPSPSASPSPETTPEPEPETLAYPDCIEKATP